MFEVFTSICLLAMTASTAYIAYRNSKMTDACEDAALHARSAAKRAEDAIRALTVVMERNRVNG